MLQKIVLLALRYGSLADSGAGPPAPAPSPPSPSPPPLDDAIAIVAKRNLQQIRSQCNAEVGIYWSYGDLPRDFVFAETAAECCNICDEDPDCYKWSFGLIDLFFFVFVFWVLPPFTLGPFWRVEWQKNQNDFL